MQDPKKTQESIETEEQKLRKKQQSVMNMVMIAAKDLAEAKRIYDECVKKEQGIMGAQDNVNSAMDTYNLFKEQADEINKLLKPYDELNAFNKQLEALRIQRVQLKNELDAPAERKGSNPESLLAQTTRKDSSSKPPEPERKRTLTQSFVGLMSSKSGEKEKARGQKKQRRNYQRIWKILIGQCETLNIKDFSSLFRMRMLTN